MLFYVLFGELFGGKLCHGAGLPVADARKIEPRRAKPRALVKKISHAELKLQAFVVRSSKNVRTHSAMQLIRNLENRN